ncbi:MAG: glutamate-5-semialdehyde dehydrogenase [Clostridia bacterium]|nr:glutamate-5-semialdehyde dehydrogenase [Clostridia bacterium]
MFDLNELGAKAKAAAAALAGTSESVINNALILCADALIDNAEEIKAANAQDIERAEKKGLSAAFIDRLTLTDKVINSMAEGLKQIAELKSPVGETVYGYENKEQGIKIVKKKVPFGVVGIIFESRPNVAADGFGLSLKTKNAVILRGGSDAINSNLAIVEVLRGALKAAGIDENAVSLIEDLSHETARAFMRLNKYVDLLIPRGGAGLIKTAVETATVPIIETGTGNCHIFVDESAKPEMAANVIFNAKTQRYSVCNACESLVIHAKIAEKVLPLIYGRLSEKQVEMRCDGISYDILKDKPNVVPAIDEDFYTEYVDAIISVKVVDSLESAIAHINEHSTRHSEAIITENAENAERFLNAIDSACVYHNASTRFSDGFIFGLGAEIGISTQKLHARGPMGLDALTTTKYIVKGNGAVRK